MKKIFLILPFTFLFIFGSSVFVYSKNKSPLREFSNKSIASKIFKKDFSFNNFDEATKSENFIRLDMSSTHFGVYTNEFEGYVMKFQFLGTLSTKRILRSKILFKVKSIDTDFDLRDGIIHDNGFKAEIYPDIIVALKDGVELKEINQSIRGTITVRGHKKKIQLIVKVTEENGRYKIEGESKVKLSKLGINDLSIPTISIHDDVTILFRIFLEK